MYEENVDTYTDINYPNFTAPGTEAAARGGNISHRKDTDTSLIVQLPENREAPQKGSSHDPSKVTGSCLSAEALFLSAEALSLFEKQRDALIKTLNYMELGLINEDEYNEDGLKFDMRKWVLKRDCGTAGCIGGTAMMLANDEALFYSYPTEYGSAPDAVEHLFFHWGDFHVTVPIAAKQLRKYLTTGECPKEWVPEN